MLLRNFAVSKSEQVYAFDKQTNHIIRTNIRNIATERNFYDLVFEGRRRSLEPALGRLETITADALKKVIVAKSLGVLSAEERTWLGFFVAAQHVRVRAFREMSKALDEQLTAKVLEIGGDPKSVEGWRPFTDEQDLTNFATSFLAEAIPDFSRIMNSKIWLLMETNKSDPFWISDNPVTMHNNRDFGPYGNIGLAVTGIQIHLPISPTLTIALWCPSILDEISEAVEKARKTHQKMRFQHLFGIGHAWRSLDAAINSYEHTIKSNDEMMARISDGRPLACTPENVMFFNSLQMLWAERHLVSCKREFSLAERMIADDPRCRHGRRMSVG